MTVTQFETQHGRAAEEQPDPLLFGLVGTGHWARVAHARALADLPGVQFTSVWGRNPQATADLANEFGVGARSDFDTFLSEVDAVAFSVPPDVQSELATRAALAGRHLLLEKPVALTPAAANALVAATERTEVASVVFFTARFQEDSRAWLELIMSTGGWRGADANWLGSVYSDTSPFNSPWRREMGGLWDLGPHAISLLWPILGPVSSVSADRGPGDVTHLVLHHGSGATSTATLTLGAPPAADGFDFRVWGEAGRSSLPRLAADPVPALRTAIAELAANARSGQLAHPCDVRFGRDVTGVLAMAQQLLEGRRASG